MKLNPEYYKPGVHHVCMFCSTPIGQLVNGKIKPLANKAHVLLSKTEPGLFIINCCADCANKVDFTDKQVLKEIRFNTVRSWEYLDSLKGSTVAKNATTRKNRLRDVPKEPGFVSIEFSTNERAKNVKKYEELNNGR